MHNIQPEQQRNTEAALRPCGGTQSGNLLSVGYIQHMTDLPGGNRRHEMERPAFRARQFWPHHHQLADFLSQSHAAHQILNIFRRHDHSSHLLL